MVSPLRGLPGHRGRFRADRTFHTFVLNFRSGVYGRSTDQVLEVRPRWDDGATARRVVNGVRQRYGTAALCAGKVDTELLAGGTDGYLATQLQTRRPTAIPAVGTRVLPLRSRWGICMTVVPSTVKTLTPLALQA
jgi:hypothetical protein